MYAMSQDEKIVLDSNGCLMFIEEYSGQCNVVCKISFGAELRTVTMGSYDTKKAAIKELNRFLKSCESGEKVFRFSKNIGDLDELLTINFKNGSLQMSETGQVVSACVYDSHSTCCCKDEPCPHLADCINFLLKGGREENACNVTG